MKKIFGILVVTISLTNSLLPVSQNVFQNERKFLDLVKIEPDGTLRVSRPKKGNAQHDAAVPSNYFGQYPSNGTGNVQHVNAVASNHVSQFLPNGATASRSPAFNIQSFNANSFDSGKASWSPVLNFHTPNAKPIDSDVWTPRNEIVETLKEITRFKIQETATLEFETTTQRLPLKSIMKDTRFKILHKDSKGLLHNIVPKHSSIVPQAHDYKSESLRNKGKERFMVFNKINLKLPEKLKERFDKISELIDGKTTNKRSQLKKNLNKTAQTGNGYRGKNTSNDVVMFLGDFNPAYKNPNEKLNPLGYQNVQKTVVNVFEHYLNPKKGYIAQEKDKKYSNTGSRMHQIHTDVRNNKRPPSNFAEKLHRGENKTRTIVPDEVIQISNELINEVVDKLVLTEIEAHNIKKPTRGTEMKARGKERQYDPSLDLPYQIDPIFKALSYNTRRKIRDIESCSTDTSDYSSFSHELNEFKKINGEFIKEKKIEAIKANPPQGDTVNMVAARPWGVKCGDPAVHDVPFGTCMLASECEPEMRVFRGDEYCGRTMFVCCALETNTFDQYQGFDASYQAESSSCEDKEFEKSEKNSEKRKRARKRKKQKDYIRRKKNRKKRIKKSIRNVIVTIKRLLDKMYKNSAKEKKVKTKLLKKFIEHLKEKYKKDRIAVKDLEHETKYEIDSALLLKLHQISKLNENFLNNSTFASIILHGQMSKTGGRMLVQAYPELSEYIKETRRSNGGADEKSDYLDYDIEYGFLYQ